MRRKLFVTLALLASCATWLPHKVFSADVKGPINGTLTTLGSTVSAYCPGFSTADIAVAAGLTGTVTAYVGPNAGTFGVPTPGPTSAPVSAMTVVNTTVTSGSALSSFPGHIYVAMNGASYANAVVTSYSSGSAIASILCTGAAPGFPSSGGGGGGGNSVIVGPTTAAGAVNVHDSNPVQPSPLYTSPVHDASPVQPSPLYTSPVHDSNPVQPSPLYTTPVHDASPVQPSPLYTMPVTTPAPVTQVTAVPNCPLGSYPCGLPTPIPVPWSFDTSSELYVNTNGSNVNVLNVPPPIPTPPTTGVLPTPAAPVYTFGMGQYSSPLPSPAPGYEGLLQTDNHSILYTRQYTSGPCADFSLAQSYAEVALSTASSTTLIATTPNTVIAHICSLTIAVSAASTVSIGYSNVSNNCSAPTNFVSYPLQSGLVKTPPRELYPGVLSAGQYVCVSSSAPVNTTVDVTYVLQ